MTTILPRGSYSTIVFKTSVPVNTSTKCHPIFALAVHPYHSTSYPKPSLRHSSTATATRIIHNQRINAPASTLPAPLVLPTRTPSQSAPSYYFSLGRAYLSFYKTGLKAVYKNYKSARALTARLPENTTVPLALRKGLLSRGEWQLIRRSRHDVARIPLFALVVAICGEFTPLVVVFMSGVVPTTCKIPKQISGAREALEERRTRSFRGGTVASKGDVGKEVEDLGREEILHVGRSLGLFSKWWDKLAEAGLGGAPSGLVRMRVKRTLEYLDMDDFAIERDGGVGEMEVEEVRIALEERGLDVLGKNDAQLKSLLKSWLQTRGRKPVTSLLLARPSVWANGD